MSTYVVTIARAYGSGGKTIGKMLSDKRGINYYDRDLIRIASENSGINERLFGLADEKVKSNPFKKAYSENEYISPGSGEFLSQNNLFNFQAETIKEIAEKESCVIVGRCADYVLRDKKNVLKVFIYASKEACIKNVMDMYAVDEKEAEKVIEKTDRERSAYYKHFTTHDWDNARNYDLCLDSSELGFEKCVDMISAYLDIKNK